MPQVILYSNRDARSGRSRHLRSVSGLAGALLLYGNATAQELPDTVKLNPFEVVAPRLSHYAAGAKVQRVDSTTMQRYGLSDLGALLANETPVFVKSYGLGSLATTSFRGGSANHIAILWNGFNIGSPMNGQLDLSLLPIASAGAVSVQYGGSTALWGSGAVGGAIHLSNEAQFGRGLVLDGSVGMGSFGDRRQQARVAFSNQRSFTSITVFNADAQNDFTYEVRRARSTEQREQTNAAFQQQGIIAEQHYRINERQRVNARVWYQRTEREIPPTRVQPTSSANQNDATLRTTAEWSRSGKTVSLAARAAYFDERIDWYASDPAAAAPSHSRTVIAEVESRMRPAEGHTVDIGLNSTYAQATSDGYPNGPRQGRAALFSMYRYQSKSGRSTASLSVRQEMLDGELMPTTASVGGEHRLLPWLTAKVQGSRVYRVPTFNDLYWRPGGDPQLLPEDGFSGDAGLVVKVQRGRFTLRSELTAFSRSIRNWIIWLPGPAYWSPRNVMEVWSRGVETDTEFAWRRQRTAIKLKVLTDHVVSTNEIPTSANDASVDKQLIYVPMYSGHARLSIEQGKAAVAFSMVYTGYRYTSTDNSAYLDPYWLSNASASYSLTGKARWRATVFIHVNNVLDTQYEIMLNRPMPQRNYQAGIQFHFQGTKSDKNVR